jgi:hypothetical protein
MTSKWLFLLLLLAGCGLTDQAGAATCGGLAKAADRPVDASPALVDCLRKLPPGARLELKPGVYRLERPIRIEKPVTITTAGLAGSSPGCSGASGTCATLQIAIDALAPKARIMPVEIAADGVTLSHMVIDGSGMSVARRRFCADPASRPLGGGLRVSGSHFTLRKSALRGIACYTALEIVAGAKNPTVTGNVIGPNGDHRPGGNWADGVTIHDSAGALVSGNLFIDNTDVQLILGGCINCRIEKNRFRHGGSFGGGAFAELMIHGWPSTSGDYRGTVVAGNDVDCGRLRRCGFGIMIGSSPWYDRPVSGAKVIGNRVANAMIGLNIDALSGPSEISGNIVAASGGRYRSDCGLRNWPAVNVAPGSSRFVRGDPSNKREGSVSTRRCLLNRNER